MDSYTFMSIVHTIPEIHSKFAFENPRSRSWTRSKFNIAGQTSYQLTSLSFHVIRPLHSQDMAISKFNIENPRSKSWARSKPKDAWRVKHPIESHPFRSMSTDPLVPEIQISQNLTLKIQDQDHSRRSHSGSNILLTLFSLHINWGAWCQKQVSRVLVKNEILVSCNKHTRKCPFGKTW